MKYEEYIKAIAPFEDFKSRADNCNDDKFKSELMKAYDKGLREIGRKILIENNITPNKVINQSCTPLMFEPISARIDRNNEVILIEKNKEIGMKLRLTGGGRCNITNNRDIEEFFDKIVNNNKFLYSALYTFSNYSLLEYLSSKGLEYKVELDEKVYTKSDKADEVIDLLKNDLRNNDVNIKYNTTITDLIIEDNVIKGVITSYGEKILGDKIIITTGGKSFPNTGSDGTMYSVLEKYGHTITPIYAALIPLVIKEEFVKKLQGVSMKDVVVSAKIKKKKIE